MSYIIFKFYTFSSPFYKRQISQPKLMYLVHHIDQIHQFWLTNLSLIKRIGGSMDLAYKVLVYNQNSIYLRI